MNRQPSKCTGPLNALPFVSTFLGPYLNVVRVERPGAGSKGNATDVPMFSDLSNERILVAMLSAISAIIGCRPPEG